MSLFLDHRGVTSLPLCMRILWYTYISQLLAVRYFGYLQSNVPGFNSSETCGVGCRHTILFLLVFLAKKNYKASTCTAVKHYLYLTS
jgi:hypothetical protein